MDLSGVLIFLALLSVLQAASWNVVVETQTREKAITCWTCPNKTTNGECNDWAPDVSCPHDKTVCRTVHRFESDSGSSILVNKECVQPLYCTHEHIGCHKDSDTKHKECVSCCSTPYCNEEVAMDDSMAHQLSLSVLNSGARHGVSISGLVLFIMMYLCAT